jgi:D-3-phosphoglycerate dehydrogenase
MRNRDVPGVVGKVGTILGKHNVNIANFSLGRKGQAGNGEAIAVVQVDNAPPENALQELQHAPEMQEVRFVHL